MTRRTSTVLLLALVSITGCDKLAKVPVLNKFIKTAADTSKAPAKAATKAPAPATQTKTPPTAAVPTQTPPKPDSAATKAPAHAAAPAPAPRASAAMDEPWTPTDTGTVKPGMTSDQVKAVWGKPATERSAGRWTYLYYRNGCEASCGTFDLVVLDSGQVVDAVVRGTGHTYGGVSSSPRDRAPKFTPPAKADTGKTSNG
ncbi:MAG TPA: outer membrane protein assembly factor BamE [Gemmatimonadales bacterium]